MPFLPLLVNAYILARLLTILFLICVNSVRSGHLKVEDSLLAGNEAGGSGGGMAAAGFADSEIVGTEVNGNRAGFSGGGIGLSEVTTLLCLEYSRPCSCTWNIAAPALALSFMEEKIRMNHVHIDVRVPVEMHSSKKSIAFVPLW